jgi:hypothetical protein
MELADELVIEDTDLAIQDQSGSQQASNGGSNGGKRAV